MQRASGSRVVPYVVEVDELGQVAAIGPAESPGAADPRVVAREPRALLARDSGVPRATLEAWTAGRREPTDPSIAELAAGLRKRASELVKLAEQLERGG